jgi:PTS system fructose-specific IIA component
MTVDLSELLRPELVDIDLTADTPEAAITALMRRLVEQGELAGELEEAAREAVLAHERKRSTGMAHGVALPHGAMDGPPEIAAALGLCRAGVPWQTLDQRPAHIVLLLVVPTNRLQVHVRVLAGIARLLNDRRLRRALRDAESAEAVYRAILEAEGAAEPL